MSVSEEKTLDLAKLDEILAASDCQANDLIPILQDIQNVYGYLPREAILEMSRRTGIPASNAFGVATFYEQFHLEPHGRHTVRCCRGTACHVNGGGQIMDTIEQVLNVKPGETTDDMRFTFETVACLGTCFLAPVMMVDDEYHGNLTAANVKDILESYS